MQPAVLVLDNRSDLLGVPSFWPKPTSDPPSSWDSWIGQFNHAIALRERSDTRELLKLPRAVYNDQTPKPEVVGPSEDATAEEKPRRKN